MKNDGWSMGMGTPGRQKKKKGKEKWEWVKVTGYYLGCVLAVGGQYELLDTSSCFPSLCVFSFSLPFDVILARFDPPKRVQSACNARDSRHWINLAKIQFSFCCVFCGGPTRG